MQEKPYNDLPGEVSEKIAAAFRVPQTARVAKQVLYDRLKELAETGELQRLSDEECQLVAEFRRFKAITKAGAVFKWQTRPDEQLVIVPPDSVLIAHPQSVGCSDTDLSCVGQLAEGTVA